MKILYRKFIYESIELPFPIKGKVDIPEGYSRMYHQTEEKNVPSIIKEGLKVSKSKGASVGDPIGIWASEDPKGFYGTARGLATVEFKIPTDELNKSLGRILIERDIPPEDILSIHEDWKNKVNSIVKNGLVDNVKAGEYDKLTGDYAKAVKYVKDNL